MRGGLDWQEISRSELSEHLQSATLIRSQAVGATCLYRCQHVSGETIAIALAGGSGLIIGVASAVSPSLERRKAQPEKMEACGT